MPKYVKKNSQTTEKFSQKKFFQSLEKIDIPKKAQKNLLQKINKDCNQDLVSSNKIQRVTKKSLEKIDKLSSLKYSLKKDLLDLGPDGFSFERYMACVFEKLNYETLLNQTRKGKHVTHEIDIMFKKKNEKKFNYSECKFRNKSYYKNGIKTALYVHSRYLDIKNGPEKNCKKYWLISNTRFSKDALKYGKGVGLGLLSPYGPEGESILDMVMQTRCFPISSLCSLSKKDIKYLLSVEITNIFDLRDKLKALPKKREKIAKEIDEILSL